MFKTVSIAFIMTVLCLSLVADYTVDFEGNGETKAAYASGNVTLNGISWNMTEVLIGTDANDFINGNRSARFRGYGTSVMSMMANKINGIGQISFYYKKYNLNDGVIDWKVEYSTDNADTWVQAGESFTPSSSLATFEAEINVAGNARIRILPLVPSGTSTKRMNIDDILLTDYNPIQPAINLIPNELSGFIYEKNHGPSESQTYTLSASNLNPASGNISISAAPAFEFSLDGNSFQSTLQIPYSGSTLGATVIYLRLKSGLSNQTYTQNAIHTGGGAEAYLGLSGIVSLSTLAFQDGYSQDFEDFVSLESLPNGWSLDENSVYGGDFGYGSGGGVRGNGVLGMQLTDSAPNNSLTASLSFYNNTGQPINSLAISYLGRLERNDQSGSPKWVVKLNDSEIPELGFDSADGINRSCSSVVSGLDIAPAESFTLQWFTTSAGTTGTRKQIGIDDVQIVPYTLSTPTLHISAELIRFETLQGQPSNSQSYHLHGSNLSSDIYLQAPNGFQLSLDDSLFETELQLPQDFNAEIYLRLSGENSGTFGGYVTHNSAGAQELLLPVVGSVSGSSGGFAQDLFISEYIEGSSNNKAIEIYNGSSSPIDLANYVLELYTNGSSTASSSYFPTGILNPAECFVVAHSSADDAVLAVANATHNGFCNFNGNDAVALLRQEPRSYVDIFGVIGSDPGSAWTAAGGYSTKDKTLVRKPEVNQGININPNGSFETLASQWDQYPMDSFSFLGSHFFNSSNQEVEAPTIQAKDLIAYPSHDEITLEWTPGNGSKRVIYINRTNTFIPPADGSSPMANTVYNSTSQQCVYNQGTQIIEELPVNACKISNLEPTTQYWFRIYEYNGEANQTKYLLSSATDNPLACETTQQNSDTGYYAQIQGYGQNLKSSLHELLRTTHSTQFSYDALWTQIPYTDEDPDNPENLIEIYTGWSVSKDHAGGGITQWNREHTWSKSHGSFGESRPAGTDLHHLRPCDATVNSAKSNRDFDEGGTLYIDASPYPGYDGDTGCYSSSNNTWEPRDEDKGDVARMMMYMAVRYEATDTSFDLELVDEVNTSGPNYGKLSTLLAWHLQDPPDSREMQRNERIFERQGNRNPFIDHPEYATMLWSPMPLDPQNISQTGFKALWASPITASSYYLQVATDSLFINVLPNYNDLNVNLSNFHVLSGLSNTQSYYYRLKSFFQSGYSMYSDFMKVDLLPSCTASLSSDEPMDEYQLDSAQISLTLSGCSFADSILDVNNFVLLGAPAGLSIQNIQFINPSLAKITLAFDDSNFDDNHMLSIQIAPYELSCAQALVSSSIKICAYVETMLYISINQEQLSLDLAPVPNISGYKIFCSNNPLGSYQDFTQEGHFDPVNSLKWIQTKALEPRAFYKAAAYRE